jgi:sortase A
MGDAVADSAPLLRRLALAAAILLAAAGLWQFGGGLWIHGKAWVAQELIARAWDEALAETGAKAGARHAAPPPWPWADTRPVARLEVPALDVDEIVLAGASGRTLAFGPGHLDGTAMPGAPGLSVVSGHRDTHFRFLEDVQLGALIRVERPDGTWQDYRVTQTRIVNVETTRIAQTATGRPRLLLTTCYPFDAIAPGGPLRYLVLAEGV